jgi:Tol biopolymer transport system component
VARILDLTKRELVGEPEIVAVAASSVPPVFRGLFSISDNGEIAYKREAQTQLVWYSRSGARKETIIEPEEGMMAPEISPDGLHIAVGRTVDNNHDVWLTDLVNGSRKKLTSNAAVDSFPVFSPLSDGRIAFESRQKGFFNVYLKSLNGTSPEVSMLPTLTEQWPVDWSSDGRFLLYFDSDPKTGGDLWAMPMTGTEAKPFPVANTPFEEHIGQFSPNQQWVAYDTNESQRFEVVVQAFPNPTWIKPVSVDGGVQPRWSADGSKLFFIAPDGAMMEASVQATDSGVKVGTPVKMFPTRVRLNPYKQQYDVSADGSFVINEVVDQWTTNSITLLLNWKSRF